MNRASKNVGVVGMQLIQEPQSITMLLIMRNFLLPNREDAPPVIAPKIEPRGTRVVLIVISSRESDPQPNQSATAS